MDRRQNAARRAIRAIIKQAGGVRQAERELKVRHPEAARYPSAGLISQINDGSRRPQPWLCDLLGIPEPERKTRTPVPWKKVAVWLADNPANLVCALTTMGVDAERAVQVSDRIWE